MFIHDAGIDISEVELMSCVNMSKMTVINETVEGKRYQRLKLVEFYEVIGRVANYNYEHTNGFTLAEKIEMLMD